MNISNRIKLLRTEFGYTQKILSDKIGLTPKMISFYENGERIPPIDIIIKFVEIFNVSSDYLLGLSDKRHCNEMSKENSVDFLNTQPISSSDEEWLQLIHSLPFEKQYEFKGEIKGYLKCLNESSTTLSEPLRKMGTSNLGK